MRATEIAHLLSARAEEVAAHLFPNGRRVHTDWCVGSLSGEPGNSLKVCISGRKAGVWADFSAGPDDRGDLIGLWQAARGLSLRDACKEALEFLNLPDQPIPQNDAPIRQKAPTQKPPSQTWLRIQSIMRKGSVSELSQVAELRGLNAFAGLEIATQNGCLFFADVFDGGELHPCWIVTDSSRKTAQARRVDGYAFSGIGGKKAKTIAGTQASWPVGLASANTPEIALVEGGPDMLAAYHLAFLNGLAKVITPVAMLGSSHPIPDDALPLFAGKLVRIYPHFDENEAGENASLRWSQQLTQAGVQNHIFNQRATGIKDLNDLVRAAQAEEYAE